MTSLEQQRSMDRIEDGLSKIGGKLELLVMLHTPPQDFAAAVRKRRAERRAARQKPLSELRKEWSKPK